MEDIKTNFEKLMEKFNDSITYNSAPKKLNFSLPDSPLETTSRKRKLSGGDTQSARNSSNDGLNSFNSSVGTPASPWETRRLRADLIESRARVSKLKQEIDKQHKVRAELEAMYQIQVKDLQKQIDFSANKIQDAETHLQTVRKREQAAKQELLRMQRELNHLKHNSEDTIQKLQKAKYEIETEARQVQNCMTSELEEYRLHTDKLSMELQLLTDEMSVMSKQIETYKEKSGLYDSLKLQNEKDLNELDFANSKIKDLESQIASYGDWKEITKNNHARLLSISEMEKEVEFLRGKNKSLHELIGNKLLLEEQVYDLKTRLEKEEGGKAEAAALQVKLKHAKDELAEWIKIAQDHCPTNVKPNPFALRAKIETLLQNDIIMVSEKNAKVSETKSIESDLFEYKEKCDIYAKNIDALNEALKRHKNFKERIQRKLLLVSKERDCYKQLLENFDKDLTMSNTCVEVTNLETQLRKRVEMLEKTLAGYKEEFSKLETELSNAKKLPQSEQQLESGDAGYEYMKKELDNLRLDNEKLRRRKEELELELEHRCLKGDFNVDRYKVLHLENNPASEAYKYADNLIEKLQAEIERLKRRNKKLEDDSEGTQSRLNETNSMTMNIKELNQLRAELESNNHKMKKLKEQYKAVNSEFREVVYMMFGYRVDRIGNNGCYTVSSMYAESPNDYLNFIFDDTSNLKLLETPYSITLKDSIETLLIGNKSLPLFLSSLTLELYDRTTVTIT
ncbi:mitotic spindle assembly checkpoint protein MAD1 isoform X2 [Teleopsis dalmanni]|uniref:mitotic spindle assembly checkpoint protein MAD1 isoform X2 n=1 Tax=Teleopsis dalmanni TaxID=139649 RepID=UPI0018CF55EC|nr:mitotic spindle assembly checkpoint protein MAD1 isoform X2 [Teleopsis dalmanni]